jgi:signal transduction histidine kinase
LLRQAVLSLLSRKKASESREVELRDLGGKRLGIYSCRLVTVMHDKREVGIVVTLRDVTAERDLVQLREEFYHGIVHDLRGPLTSIDGFTAIMKARMGKLAPEQVNTYLGYVTQSAQRMRQLVADILDTAKIESGTMELKLEPAAAADFAERAKALYALQEETLGVRMTFNTTGAPTQAVRCDRNLVDRVLANLLGNAIKFTPKGGQVGLRISAAGADAVEFAVQDTGPGIPKDKLEFVFEKFKQLEGGSKSAGYGLGLSICKKIVELHHGRIWCESEPGQGSRFVFRLPLTPPSA